MGGCEKVASHLGLPRRKPCEDCQKQKRILEKEKKKKKKKQPSPCQWRISGESVGESVGESRFESVGESVANQW